MNQLEMLEYLLEFYGGVASVAHETGISTPTLYSIRHQQVIAQKLTFLRLQRAYEMAQNSPSRRVKPKPRPLSMENQNWAPVAGYEGLYEVSDAGNVYGIKKNKLLRPGVSNGYLYVHLHKDSKGQSIRIHALVARAFIGERPEGYSINHKDCDKTNNDVSNLEYVTQAQNMRHAVLSGRMGKLSLDAVRAIREINISDLNIPALAAQLEVSYCTIEGVLKCETFADVPQPDGSLPVAQTLVREGNGLSSENKELIAQMIMGGRASAVHLAERFGVSVDVIYKVVRAHKKAWGLTKLLRGRGGL